MCSSSPTLSPSPPPPARLRTTTAQYGIWVAQQVDPGSPAYLTAESIELDGPLDVPLLQSTIAEVLKHCDALHMRFEWDADTLWQHPQTPQCEVPLIDFSHTPDPEAAATAWVERTLATPCDVTRQALYRTALLNTAPDRHAWVLVVHHIALDGFGYSLLQQAVARRYNARRAHSPLPTLPDWQLHRVIDAEARYHQSGGFTRDRDFWKAHLREVPAPAQLGPDHDPSDTPRRLVLELPPDEVRQLQAAAQQAGVDWAAWMLSVLGLWLARQSGQRALCVGIPVMNRLGTPALTVPCMAMNIVPFCVQLHDTDTLRDTARQAAQQLRSIRPHLYYRYGWIRGDLGLLESGQSLFNQAINLMPFERHVAFAGLTSRMRPWAGGPVKDLNIVQVVDQGRWRITLEAHPNAYTAPQAQALVDALHNLLRELAVASPEQPLRHWLQAVPAPSHHIGPELSEPPVDVLRLLQQAAHAHPTHPALVWPEGQLSYAQLLQRCAHLAAHLTQHGVAAGDVVAVLLPRSPDAIVAALAILWCGATYQPLDPTGPAARTHTLLARTAPRLVLTQAPWHTLAHTHPTWRLDLPPPTDATASPCAPASAEQTAYLLHTSGSTGVPKGVRVSRGALAHFIASTRPLYQVSHSDRVLQFAPLHFDASLEEIFITLCHGATLVLRDDAMLDSVETFAADVERLRLTVLDLPTAYWHALTHGLDADAAQRLHRLRLVIVGGEALLPERAARWATLLPGPTLLNTYGPTETTIIATAAALSGPHARWQAGQPVPIGPPRPGVTLRIADTRHRAVPTGRSGELLVLGPALAIGYHDDPEQTAQRFITLPDTGERAYRTGDLARWVDGELQFLGRTDAEIKISGLRIDPLEIENALLGVPHVREAAVHARRHAGGVCTLEAFVVGEVTPDTLRQALREQLPAPAVPDVWHPLTALPRNANGKIDRPALAALAIPSAHSEGNRGTSGTSPTNDPAPRHEAAVKQAWCAVLGDQPLSADTNFFALGGKSLQAIQVTSQLSQALQRDVAVSLLFRHATLRAFACALDAPAAHRPPGTNDPFAPLLTLQPGEPDAPTLWCLPPAEGLTWSYLRLARHLPRARLVGLQMHVADTRQAAHFDQLVAAILQRMLAEQPHGPFRLLGWSLGGNLAQSLAARLQSLGHEVALLALLDCYPAAAWRQHPAPSFDGTLRTLLGVNGEFDTDTLSTEALLQRLQRAGSPFAGLGPEGLQAWADAAHHQTTLFRASDTERFDGLTVFYRAQRNPPQMPRPDHWAAWLPNVSRHALDIDCTHDGMSDPHAMAQIGADLARHLPGSTA